MKKYLLLAAAGLTAAACADKGLENNHQNGELEESYVAISLAAGDMNTKAGTDPVGEYIDGTTTERQVKSAHVFFFYENGDAFVVDQAANVNYVTVLEGFDVNNAPENNNVSDIQNAVLVIENRKGEHPTKMIAVLNWVPAKSYSISELQTKLSDLGNETDGFIMSNAVYAQNGVEMSASIITPENIAETPDLAKANPVKIYVERLAAKVTFDAVNDGKFEVGYLNNKNVDANKVYAQIKGWELYKDYNQSTYVKDIDPSWTNLGFNWNDPDWNRSYWTSSDKAEEGEFASKDFSWNSENNLPLEGYFYCGENVDRTEADRTKVIIKAQLLGADNQPIELARWHSTDYVGDEALKTAVVNTLKYSIYSGVTSGGTTEYTSLLPGDLTIVEANEAPAGSDIKAFEVFFQLSTEGLAKEWYEYQDGTYASATDGEINTRLAQIQPALKYEDGQTYYYTDIKHLGAEGKTGEFGVVRNHVYQFNITDINGYGTPVFDKDTDFTTPQRPVDVETFVAAEINILSWRVVSQNETLQ
jgi:hypothetical protein